MEEGSSGEMVMVVMVVVVRVVVVVMVVMGVVVIMGMRCPQQGAAASTARHERRVMRHRGGCHWVPRGGVRRRGRGGSSGGGRRTRVDRSAAVVAVRGFDPVPREVVLRGAATRSRLQHCQTVLRHKTFDQGSLIPNLT